MNSLDHGEGLEGLAVMDDRQSLRAKAQQSLAALGTCWRVEMRAWRMVDRDSIAGGLAGGGAGVDAAAEAEAVVAEAIVLETLAGEVGLTVGAMMGVSRGKAL